MKLTCNQFEALMHFYINNELKPTLSKVFEEHMQSCKNCYDKYNTFKQVINELRNSYNVLLYKNASATDDKPMQNKTAINTYISAYADNELDIDENIKLKKIIINKPQVRKKLENIYSLKELLKNSFEKTKPEEDFSNKILKSIYNKNIRTRSKDILYALVSFIILSIIWGIMLISSIYNFK